MEEFKALWAENIDAKVETTVRTFNKEDLPDGEVLVEVQDIQPIIDLDGEKRTLS